MRFFTKEGKKLAILGCIFCIGSGCSGNLGHGKPGRPEVYKVPQWAKQVVWYQIFPERFRNGDPNNDPKVEDIQGSWPHDASSEWHLSPWTSDWYAPQPWEQDGRGFYYHVQRRRYGGDLQGVLDKLDYLTDLGINAIYFNPLFESPSLHKYDAASYHHIDDNFGPNPEKDKKLVAQEIPYDPNTWRWTTADSLFLTLIKECHSRGIRIIIDGVWNHVGLNFWAFKDLVQNQRASRFRNWFIVKKWDDSKTPENEFEYACWFGFKELPEIREDENGFVDGVREYIYHSVKRWMDPNNDGDPSDGIDGWRLDVAEQVGFVAWRNFREWVRAINPQAYLVGEIWWEKWPRKMFNAAPWLQGDVFDGVMNYRFAWRTTQFFIDRKNKILATEFDSLLAKIRSDYPPQANYVLQNLIDSHDTARLGSMIVNPDQIYGSNNRPQDNPDYDVRKPNAEEIQIQKLIVTFQMTYLGAPMIYYGDEAGMWGAKDPDNRKPMLWPDLKYEDEVSHPLGKKRPRDKNQFDYNLFNYYRKLIRIRRDNLPLMLGTFNTLLTDDRKDLYVFERAYGGKRIIVVLNNSSNSQELVLSLAGSGLWVDLLTGEKHPVRNGKVYLQINRKTAMVLKRK
ncbi:MAG TPA: alpha-amylase [Bacteroidetes bacterium]|nr:alpha-amylase [Bacteroidota bacterium]